MGEREQLAAIADVITVAADLERDGVEHGFAFLGRDPAGAPVVAGPLKLAGGCIWPGTRLHLPGGTPCEEEEPDPCR